MYEYNSGTSNYGFIIMSRNLQSPTCKVKTRIRFAVHGVDNTTLKMQCDSVKQQFPGWEFEYFKMTKNIVQQWMDEIEV